jgi:hypothetical protein
VLEPKDLEYAAELLGQLAFDPVMREQVIAGQRTRLEAFSEATAPAAVETLRVSRLNAHS